MSQLALFKPSWWTIEDSILCKNYWEQENRDDYPGKDDEWNDEIEQWCESLHPNAEEYRCRNCYFWDSHNGLKGECFGPELQCGTTDRKSGCEQWFPRE